MLDVVTPIAESNEAEKRLDMGFIVVCPSLVTIQLTLGSTDAAHLTVLRIHLFAECIPWYAPHSFMSLLTFVCTGLWLSSAPTFQSVKVVGSQNISGERGDVSVLVVFFHLFLFFSGVSSETAWKA